MSCHFCYNAHVWASELDNTEDYFDEGLNDNNDGSSCGIGTACKGYQIWFNSGMGVPCNVEVGTWKESSGWVPIARYYPQFCPVCGRKLDEYIITERGVSFERKK